MRLGINMAYDNDYYLSANTRNQTWRARVWGLKRGNIVALRDDDSARGFCVRITKRDKGGLYRGTAVFFFDGKWRNTLYKIAFTPEHVHWSSRPRIDGYAVRLDMLQRMFAGWTND